LIDQSTGSGFGRALDASAGFFGQETEGDIAIAKLQPIADKVVKMVPRFEGPQSDKDALSYQQAGGMLADPTLPTKRRKAAAKEILRLHTKYPNQFVSSEMAAEGTGPSAEQNIPTVTSLEEARKLPSGTQFKDPNGILRVAP
jgi:hypothetical protein